MKIIEFNPHGTSFSAQHLQKFAQENGLSWQVEVYPAFDEGLLAESKAAWVDIQMSEQIFSGLSTMPPLVRHVECFDSFLAEEGRFYPRLLLFEALRELIVARDHSLDIRSCAYITGLDARSRAVAAVLADLGFTKIYFIADEESEGTRALEKIRKRFIGLDFRTVGSHNMTVQMDRGSLLVNCVDLKSHASLQEDLSYFNFMKQDALILDLCLASEASLLLDEADKAGLKNIRAHEFFLKRDLLFFKKMGVLDQIDATKYAESWQEFLKSDPSSSYKKSHT